MTAARRMWIIVLRDPSYAVRWRAWPETAATVVLDADTGLVR